MSPNVVFFTGAPESKALDWDEAGLLNGFSRSIASFAGLAESDESILQDSSNSFPAWRSIPLDRQNLTTGYSQDHGWQPEYEGASFFTTSDITSFIEEPETQNGQSIGSSVHSAEDVLSQFYEHSYTVHEEIPSSQIPPDSAPVTDSYRSFGTSFGNSYETQSESGLGSQRKDIPIAGNLHNLNEIPHARYLNSIQPQTMTVNLIIGIISLPTPRTIKTRHGATVELLEALVGDDTKSGFAINFWLGSSGGELRTVLDGLRPQDVILVRNVALSHFRGRVYGQSLRKEMTKVYLLFRNRVDRDDARGCYKSADLAAGVEIGDRQVAKTIKVKDWVEKFVGVGNRPKRDQYPTSQPQREVLPPDTQ